MSSPVRGFPTRFPVRSDDRRPLRYRIVQLTGRLVLRLIFGRRLRIEGEQNIPTGPCLVVCNHLSNLDPLIFGSFFPRTLFAMAKRELFANRLLAWMWAGCNCFPVDRGTPDRRALRTALEVCARPTGRLLLFVEGTRATSPGMKRAEQGVGFLMRRTGIPVLPAAVWGTERALVRGHRLPRRVDIHLAYGKPFMPPREGPATTDNQAAADLAAVQIAALLPADYRGVYAEPVASLAREAQARAASGAI
jgi:1-acyl-sn-glycerol-3-phosphate acyltransferase